MQKILVPFDGSPSARHAIQYVAETYRGNTAVQVHVLNVQETAIYFDAYLPAATIRDIETSILESGRTLLLEAAAVLQQHGVPHQLHVQLGVVHEKIAHQVNSLGCQSVVMGTRGLGSMSGLLLGSVATKVIHQVQVPVTLIK